MDHAVSFQQVEEAAGRIKDLAHETPVRSIMFDPLTGSASSDFRNLRSWLAISTSCCLADHHKLSCGPADWKADTIQMRDISKGVRHSFLRPSMMPSYGLLLHARLNHKMTL